MLRNRLAQLREERAEDGFTLIELLVVVVIIGILIAIAIPLYLNYQKGANDKSAMSDLRGAVSTLEQCNSNNGSYPTSVPATTATATNVVPCTGQQINYSKGTTIVYVPNSTTAGSATAYDVYSSNSSGSGATYCYSSAAGGQVKTATTLTNASAASTTYASTCPS